MEVDAGHGRGIGDVEGHGAGIALAAHRQVGDDGCVRVQRELVAHLLRLRGRAVRRGLNRQGVAAVGQRVTGFIKPIEEGFLTGKLARLRPTGLEVVEGLAHAVDRVGAHRLARGVAVGERHRGDGTQHAGHRRDLVGGTRPLGARGDEALRVDRGDQVRILLVRQRVERAQRDGRVRVDQSRTVDVHGRRLVIRPLAVEDVRGAPGAVEAQVGDGQARRPVLAREGHGTVDEGSLGRVRRGEGRELGLGGHRDAHGGGRIRGDRDLLGVPGLGHAVAREGQRDARARPVLRVLEEEALLDHFGERLAAERVGVGGVGEVGQAHLEGPAVRSIAEVGLGSGGIGGSDDGRVDGRGGGSDRVNGTRTDLTRRVVGAVPQLDVDERVGCAHDEVGNDGVLLLGAHAGECGVARDALAHERADAGDLRGGHRGARQALVLVTEVGGHDVAAGGRDFGLERQVGGHTPR